MCAPLKRLDNKSLTVLELKRLLFDLKDQRPDICIRYRLMGEMWRENFTKIVTIADDRLFVEDLRMGFIIHIQNMANIMQFEIDHSFQNFQAHYHYDIVLDHS
jgi:hypothetical protein